MIRYMLDVRGFFGHAVENNKRGWMMKNFLITFKNPLCIQMQLPRMGIGFALNVICDDGPGHLNADLFAYMYNHSFLLYPGVPNTTVVTQEMDQSYGLFQLKLCANLQVLIDKCLHAKKLKSLSLWIVGLIVFGGEDPKTGCVVNLAFQAGFAHMQNRRAWTKVGAVPLTMACLQNSEV